MSSPTGHQNIRQLAIFKTQNVRIHVVYEEESFGVLLEKKKNCKMVSEHSFKWVLSKVGSHATPGKSNE